MVLQRNAQINIWGWSSTEEDIIIQFNDRVYTGTADPLGQWLIHVDTGNAGGPYEITIETGDGAERIEIRNILLGDVWLCSGQSNMECRWSHYGKRFLMKWRMRKTMRFGISMSRSSTISISLMTTSNPGVGWRSILQAFRISPQQVIFLPPSYMNDTACQLG
ncbi:hypothetical protein [Cohnella endophytica]|uniref:hypothetical protein n=1 Tax=Cohnella endophytica TaxID=2419778 RepID=UPI0018F5F4C3|nr:hypothetical protein [Cohnella endophytica]